jgi:AraC-like DNA-binding protein
MIKEVMQTKEWTKLGRNPQLGLDYLHAHYVDHAYPRHSHDYYVFCLIEHGRQSFLHQGATHYTPPGGVILINPGAVHTGQAFDEAGFEMRSLYPTVAHMNMALTELTGRQRSSPPFFKDVRIDYPWASRQLISLHQAMTDGHKLLEFESRFLWTLAQFIQRYADVSYTEQKTGRERNAVLRACQYIDENFAKGISLKELAEHVALSPYYFLRVFRAQVGLPPYMYLENVRVGHAQRLIERGKPLAEVAVEAGFSSQSHLTRHFKRIIGATPGQYAAQIRS